MQHVKIEIAKCVFVSSVSTGGYGKPLKERPLTELGVWSAIENECGAMPV